MSAHNMFTWRNKKTIQWITPLIWSYDICFFLFLFSQDSALCLMLVGQPLPVGSMLFCFIFFFILLFFFLNKNLKV